MAKPVETVVDGFTVSTTKHAPLRGTSLKAKMLRLVAPAARAIAASGVESLDQLGDLDMTIENVEKIAPVIEALAAAIKPEELPGLIVEVLSHTSIIVPGVDGRTMNRVELNSELNVDMAFDEREGTMYKVIAHALGVNFGGPFVSKLLSMSGADLSPPPAGA